MTSRNGGTRSNRRAHSLSDAALAPGNDGSTSSSSKTRTHSNSSSSGSTLVRGRARGPSTSAAGSGSNSPSTNSFNRRAVVLPLARAGASAFSSNQSDARTPNTLPHSGQSSYPHPATSTSSSSLTTRHPSTILSPTSTSTSSRSSVSVSVASSAYSATSASVSSSSTAPTHGTFLFTDDPPASPLFPPPQQPPPAPVSPSQPLQPLPRAGARDSVLSIIDDPFFLRFQFPGHDITLNSNPGSGSACDLGAAAGPGAGASAPSTLPAPLPTTTPDFCDYDLELSPTATSVPKPAWPPPRKESLSITDPTPWAGLNRSPTMDTINVAVIGADGVGKSAFIQRALRLARPPQTNITAIRLDIEGVPHIVTLIELDLEFFDVDPRQQIKWPKQINGHMVPRIDGALILYDVMNRESVKELPPTLSALGNSNLPTILVATKCDNPDNFRQLNPEGLVTMFPTVVADFKTSSHSPGNTRECLQAIIRAAISNRRAVAAGGDRSDATRRRAASSAAHLDTASADSVNGRPISPGKHSQHSRASSDLSLLRGFPAPTSTTDRDAYYRGQNSRSPRIEYPNTPQLTTSASSFGTVGGPGFGPAPGVDMGDDEISGQTLSGMMVRGSGIRLDSSQESFLDVESDAESYRYSDDIPILQRSDEAFFEKPAKMTGVAFDDLVERLLAQRMTRADNSFADIFLCLYRKFVPPNELFAAILTRLDRVKDDKSAHYLVKAATQLRIVEVIAKWVSSYPGDFARPATKRRLEDLVRHLSSEPIFSMAAQQMRHHLEHDVCEDDDTGWEKSDEAGPPGVASASSSTTAIDSKRGSGGGGEKRGSQLSDSLKSVHIGDETRSSQRQASTTSFEVPCMDPLAAPYLLPPPPHLLGASRIAQFQFHSQEDYEREAASMVPSATLPLNKIRYRIFMDLDPEDVADEMTRIDWIMFSSIRTRDLVRSVSLSPDQRERCRSLANVNRMVSHFNHVAKWVANMILIRDKAKHRAPCLQKFMVIAGKLRALNNYNGLAAVLAGINGSAIHRLGQTRSLVDETVQKRFAGLGLLMGTQKSHFAYRLAWENSSLPRIPFMPLHRRDLVSAEEGSRTFVGPQGDRINWKKFEILGEVLLPIMKSQGTPYPNLKKHEPSRELVLDCRMPTDEEEIYVRSVHVEPTSGSTEGVRRKFLWR